MPTTAKGVISRKKGEISLEDFVLDEPGNNEILVRILASGVCHTDLIVKNGVVGDDFPFLLGHEGAGIVEKTGPGVDRLKVGDYVILAWRAPCGRCRFCQFGQPHLCAASLNAQPRMRTSDGLKLNPVLGIGTFCTHTIVHADQAIPISRDLPPAEMSLIGCGVMTGVGAALYSAGIRPGTSAAVFGCGGVGDSVIQAARIAGATTIIGVDVDERKLKWAKEFGATHVINARETEPVAAIKAITGGNGVNYSFECIGKPETLDQALFCRDLAGTCVLIGVSDGIAKLDLPMQKFFSLGGSLRVSWYGDCLPTRDFPMLARWFTQGQLKLSEVVTRKIKLEDTAEAFKAMERGETLRSVIMFE